MRIQDRADQGINETCRKLSSLALARPRADKAAVAVMLSKTVTRTVFCLFVLVFAGAGVLAQNPGSPALKRSTAASTAFPRLITNHPYVSNNAGLKTIFSNLGNKTDAYDYSNGWDVLGPDSNLGESQWIAMPFTPKKAATVTKIEIAVTWAHSGADAFNLVLAADDAGLPGQALYSWDLKQMPDFGYGGCCTLDVGKYAMGVELKANTQYWVVAQTDSRSIYSRDVWNWVWTDNVGPMAGNVGGAGWQLFNNGNLCAFAVLGQ